MNARSAVSAVDRRKLLWGLAWFAGGTGAGMAVASIPAIASASTRPAQIPAPKVLQGTVLATPAASGTDVSVQIGPAVHRVAYQTPYVPVPGDVVDVSFVDTGDAVTPLILGARAGRSGNLIVNGDFARIVTLKSAAPPPMWTHYRAAGKDKAINSMIVPRYQKPMMTIDSWPDTSGDHWAVSAAFPVTAGDVIKADAAMTIDVVGQINVTVELRISWWADSAVTYPAKPLADNVLMSAPLGVDGDRLLEGQATAAAGAVAARVAVRVKHAGDPDSQYTLYVGHVYAMR